MFGTLIADGEQLYDPRRYHDRLLLGLSGMMSEAELHQLKVRVSAKKPSAASCAWAQPELPCAPARWMRHPQSARRSAGAVALGLCEVRGTGQCRCASRATCNGRSCLCPRAQLARSCAARGDPAEGQARAACSPSYTTRPMPVPTFTGVPRWSRHTAARGTPASRACAPAAGAMAGLS
jgi:hypothetical protein